MKLPTFLLPILLCCFFAFGQTSAENKTVPVYEVDPILKGKNVQFVPMNFNASQLKEKIPADLQSLTIERIDLVYTTYKENPDFDQNQLNRSRVERLQTAWPETKNPLINWNFIGQTQATEKGTARDFFHGFVVYYREKPTPESMEREMDLVDAYLRDGVFLADKPALPGSSLYSSATNTSSAPKEPSVEKRTEIMPVVPKSDFVFVYSADGVITIDDEAMKKLKDTPVEIDKDEDPRVSSLRVEEYQNECYTSKAGIFSGNSKKFLAFNDSMMSLGNHSMGTYSYDGKKEKSATKFYYVYYSVKPECHTVYAPTFANPYTWDSEEFNAVQATFERHPQWQNTLVIMDVTGSMSPYIAKTMAWVKATQDSSQVKAFTFFNDGDATPDRSKKTGSVGGVYSVENESYKPVYERMKYTMSKGGGGDCPENNIEATIKGIKRHPNCGEIVMVADNWATPRDLSLLKQIEVPIHFILCGGQGGINIAYVQAAYNTGGSVHTIEDDLDMRSIKPGKQFRIGRNYFTISGGRIVKAEHK